MTEKEHVDRQQRRLIGEMLPIGKISKGGTAEKGRHNGRINNMHRWWASRPTNVSRVTAYAALVNPPLSDHEDMINDMCDYAKSTDPNKPAIRDRARRLIRDAWNGNIPKVLDPFGGSGALPFAAAWLGCESHSIDYNPVAVLLQKCVLEYPAKYGKKLIHDVRKAANDMEENIREATKEFYPNGGVRQTDDDDGQIYRHNAYRWCRTLPCVCGTVMPLVKSHVTSSIRGIHLYPKVDDKTVRFGIAGGTYGDGPKGSDHMKGTIDNNISKCVACGHTYTNTEMSKMFSDRRGGEQMMVAVSTHPKKTGRFYFEIDEDDITLYDKCASELEKRRTAFRFKYGVDPVPTDAIPTPDGKEYCEGGTQWHVLGVVMHGYTRWEHLFNTRQLLCLVSILDILRQTEKHLIAEHGQDYAVVVMSYLSLVLNKTIEKYSRLSPWESERELVRGCFAQQMLKNVWDYAETEPSDIWHNSVKSVLEGLNPALSAASESKYHVQMASATKLPYDNDYFDAVCTDPPYYDSMQYSKVADFFYVWLKKTIGHLPPYKKLFRSMSSPKKDEVVQTSGDAVGFTGTSSIVRNEDGYQQLMTDSLKEMYRVLKPDGILTLVYAHKSTAGWETLIQAMFDSGFVITAAWPINSESKLRAGARDTASLASSIYMVGRKWKRLPKQHYREVWQELRGHVCSKLDYFMKSGIGGADFYIAAIGASCEIYSKYEGVLRDDTGEPVTVREVLDDMRGLCSNHIVKTLTTGSGSAAAGGGSIGDIDPMSKLYISWRWAYGDRSVGYDEARKMFTGVGLDISDYTGGIMKKEGSAMMMLDSAGRNEDMRPRNTIDVLHKAMRLWHDQRGDEMRELLVTTGNTNNPGFYAVCQAIIEAGAGKSGAHAETVEKHEIEAFVAGRKAESTSTAASLGTIDSYV